MRKRLISTILATLFSAVLFVGCTGAEETKENTAVEETTDEEKTSQDSLILSTTTSTQDSGLLDYILPDFQEKEGVEVKVVAVGTGKALQMGKDGESDVLLVHAKADEEQFVADGHGTVRYDVMYNDFILLGPSNDPAGIADAAKGDMGKALQMISENGQTFVSRGDDSGTHKKELSIWKDKNIDPTGQSWYLESGQGMGDTLKIVEEKQGYTIADRSTYIKMKNDLDLKIICEGDESLLNQYSVIPVNPEKNDSINAEGAEKFVDWITSDETQELIGTYKIEGHNDQVFYPNADK
jgi:tungstate transport system substrate-binding protein